MYEMKVAIVGNKYVGKSSFIVMLAALYSRTQHKDVSIFATDVNSSLLSQVDADEQAAKTKTVNVYKAMLETATIHNDNIKDYGQRIGYENVYAFDIYASTIVEAEADQLFLQTIKRVTTDLTLVEVKGDYRSERNMNAMKACDAILYLFNPYQGSLDEVVEYRENCDQSLVVRTGFVCQKFDANAISGKRLLKGAGITERETMFVPYCPYVMEHSMSGDLNKIAHKIVDSEPEVIILRSRLLEVMQFLFDNGAVKLIKDFKTWHKS